MEEIKKDASVTIRCTSAQKSLLIKRAVEDTGLTISDFVLFKVFNETIPTLEPKKEIEKEVFADDEKTALEELISKQRSQILDLNNQVFELKAEKVSLTEKSNTVITTGILEDEQLRWVYDWVKENLFNEAELPIEDFIRSAAAYTKYNTESRGNFFGNKSFVEFVNDLQTPSSTDEQLIEI